MAIFIWHHGRYVEEVCKLFDAHKVFGCLLDRESFWQAAAGYGDKSLRIVVDLGHLQHVCLVSQV